MSALHEHSKFATSKESFPMASKPTADSKGDSGTDSNSFEGEGDEGRGGKSRSLKRLNMNSKAMVSVSCKKRYYGGVSPAPEGVQPPAHLKASTPKRSSDAYYQPHSLEPQKLVRRRTAQHQQGNSSSRVLTLCLHNQDKIESKLLSKIY